jgi:rabenosyn-5
MELVCYIDKTISVDFLFVGATRSYTESFRAIRNSRLERYAVETNKLLIRLDKLIVDLPADPVKRKGM